MFSVNSRFWVLGDKAFTLVESLPTLENVEKVAHLLQNRDRGAAEGREETLNQERQKVVIEHG